MTITNTELAAQLQDVTTSWQSFNLQQLNWLTTTADTVTLTDHVTLQEITVKSLYKIEADYDAIFDDATGDLVQIEQMLTDTQALQANVTTMHDAVVAYDVTFTGYLAQTAQDVTDCDDSAAAAAASALAAANSAVAAGGHADDAEAARDLAQGYRNEAETFKNQAQTAKTDAESEAAAALTSRNEAMTFRNEAETAETNAQAAEAKAQDWAEKPEDTEVEPGKFSALHHAAKAEDSATNAATSEVNAGTSETNAANSAAAALVSENNAATSESNAAISEANALTYKNDATASANSASTSESGAQTWNTNAQLAKDAAETARDKAQQWAEEAEDVEVETGKFSAKHHAEKAFDHSTNAAIERFDAETAASLASDWAEAPEGQLVDGTGFSAYHHSKKAGASADLAEDWASAAYGVDVDGKGGHSAYHYSIDSANSAVTAENHKDDSETNALDAIAAKNSAEAARDDAEEWANHPEDTVIPGQPAGTYSAKHWAAKAEEQVDSLDFEEGTWNPTLIARTTNGSISYTAQQGRYRYIKGELSVWGYIECSYSTNPTGGLQIDLSSLNFRAEKETDGTGYPAQRSQFNIRTVGFKPASPTDYWVPTAVLVDTTLDLKKPDINHVTGTSDLTGADCPSTGSVIKIWFYVTYAAVRTV